MLSREHTRRLKFSAGCPTGVEPVPPGSQPGMRKPPHYGHRIEKPKAESGEPRGSSLSRFPLSEVDLMGVEPITPILQGSVAPNGMEARTIQWSRRALNPQARGSRPRRFTALRT